MADIPNASETVRDRGLGLSSPSTETPAVMGVCSLGDDNAVKAYSSIPTLLAERGEGPGVEATATLIATVGGPVVLVNGASTVAASFGSATFVASDSGPDITPTGSAAFDANVHIEITLPGGRGVGKFKYCLDNFTGASDSDRTFSGEILIPASGAYVIPSTGVTITFEDDAFVLGETYTNVFNCAAQNATDVGAGMDALKNSVHDWSFLYVRTSNNAGDSTAHATLGAAVQAKLTAFETASLYRRAIIATNLTGDDPSSALDSLVATRMLFAHGRARMISAKSAIGYAVPVVPAATAFAIRAGGVLISTDLKRGIGNGLTGGPLPNVLSILEDEEKNPTGLDNIKVSTLRTMQGKDGFFITQGRLKSADGSDFVRWERGRVMDRACETAHSITVTFIGRGLRTNEDGTIDERDIVRLEDEVNEALEAKILSPQNQEGTKGHASDVLYRINRELSLTATDTIEGEVAMRPLDSASYIRTTLSFSLKVRPDEEAA